MGALAANNAWGELNVPLLPTTPQIVLQAGQGDRFPNAVNGVSWFYVTLADKENNLEIVRCTNRIGDTLDVERGADGTTAKEYKAGDKVELRPCAALFNDKVSADHMESELKALKAELGKEDDTIYDRIDTEIDSITKNYATTEYVDTKIKEINKNIETGSLTKDEAKKLYLPLAGGTLTGALAIKSDDGAGLTITGGDLTLKAVVGPKGGNLNMDGSLRADTVTADSLTATSDERLKKNISPFVPGIGKTLCEYITPVWFNWKKDNSRSAGVIAQELQSIYPVAVHRRDDGMLTVDYLSLIPVLISAIRDLSYEIEELKKHGTNHG